MGKSGREYFLRPEASPVPYETLSKRHKKARRVLDSMIEALQAAAESAAKKRLKGDELSIDMNRLSRIFFVSGEPGSGKTTLYLTLKAMLSSKSEYRKYREGYKNEGKLGGLEEPAVRWLEPIDLEVAGEEGENLLAAVLVRLVRKLDESKSGFSKSCGDAIKKLEQLTADIGLAWDGNLQARASELDPDMFSMEVMRAQRARLGVNERLREALDELAESDCCGCRSNTLFVLPVDDLYLNPKTSLQLLRLLRMISVPRLFFLIMGDITTVEAIFVEKALADWTAVAGAEIFRARPARLDEALARARELKARFLRKLLPPGQRDEIEVMEWDEALEFKPEPHDGKEDKAATLRSLLEVDLDSSPESTTNKHAGSSNNDKGTSEKMTLLKHLISPPFEDKQSKGVGTGTEDKRSREEQENQEKKAREAYTALQILDATPREIMDLWTELKKLRHQNEPPDEDQTTDGTQCKDQKTDDAVAPLLLSVVKFVQLVIEEQNFLYEREQDSLRVVLPRRHYSPRDFQFDMGDRLRLEADQDPWIEKFGRSLWVRKHRSWKLKVQGDIRNEGAEPFANLLPPRPTAWLVLLHDLAWEWNIDSVKGNLVNGLCKGLEEWRPSESEAGTQSEIDDNTEVQRFRLQHIVKLLEMSKQCGSAQKKQTLNPPNDLHGWAVWHNESSYEHFPMPPFVTFRDLDRFMFVWSSGLDWLEEQRNQAQNGAVKASEQARAAQNLAVEAKKAKKEGTVAQQLADKAKASTDAKQADDAQKQADNAKKRAEDTQKQADDAQTQADEAQKRADEAQNRVGVDESQRISKFIYLWGVAGSTVLDKQYRSFAVREKDWFDKRLKDFTNENEGNDRSKQWRQRVYDFFQRVRAT